jgi:carbamoyl-phosphate synthase large subunit
VVKIPRFAFEKFPGADRELTTTMKSVGEAMAFGRSFVEAPAEGDALARAVAVAVLGAPDPPGTAQDALDLRPGAARPAAADRRAGAAARRDARAGLRGDRHRPRGSWTSCCRWSSCARARGGPRRTRLDARTLRRVKRSGFADRRSPRVLGCTERERPRPRHALGVRPVFKTSTPAPAEFAAETPYHYSSYDEDTEVRPGDRPRCSSSAPAPTGRQGIEFDYACVHASFALPDGRLRDSDGQLQPGDRLDRLRHE